MPGDTVEPEEPNKRKIKSTPVRVPTFQDDLATARRLTAHWEVQTVAAEQSLATVTEERDRLAGENERLRKVLEFIAINPPDGNGLALDRIAKHALTSTPSGAALSEEEKGTPE